MMTTEISTTPARGLALQTMDDAMKFGKMLADSDFAPKDFKGKAASCVLAVQAGAEIGFGPMQSIQCIAVINGRPSIWGDAALALVMASPVCEYVRETVEGEGDAMVATCTAKRRGYPEATVSRFSVADAKKAGLWGKSGPWSQYPKRMLQLRARGFALRDAFPDVLKGLVTAEEAQDYPKPEPVARPPVEYRPKLDAPQVALTEDPEAKARLAVSRASTVEMLDALRTLVDRRHAEGVFTEAQKAALVDVIHHKAEMLLADEEKGQEFEHEAAGTEVLS
jgi:hypothetical protein